MHLFNRYSLVTAHILYRMPDHQMILQTYVWQDYDTYPGYPKLRAFLDRWPAAGPLHSVQVANTRTMDHEFTLH